MGGFRVLVRKYILGGVHFIPASGCCSKSESLLCCVAQRKCFVCRLGLHLETATVSWKFHNCHCSFFSACHFIFRTAGVKANNNSALLFGPLKIGDALVFIFILICHHAIRWSVQHQTLAAFPLSILGGAYPSFFFFFIAGLFWTLSDSRHLNIRKPLFSEDITVLCSEWLSFHFSYLFLKIKILFSVCKTVKGFNSCTFFQGGSFFKLVMCTIYYEG